MPAALTKPLQQVCGDRSEVMLPERAKVKLGWRLDLSYESRFAGTQFTCFTGTKVQLLARLISA